MMTNHAAKRKATHLEHIARELRLAVDDTTRLGTVGLEILFELQEELLNDLKRYFNEEE